MDVLNPELEEIDGCLYRVNLIDGNSYGKNAENVPYQEFNDMEDPDSCPEDNIPDDDEDIPNLTVTATGYFTAKLHVARIYLPFLIGKRGSTLQRLERETRAYIKIPRREEQGSEISIRSRRREFVATAYRRIKLMVNGARQKQNYTHFISIPLVNEETKKRFLNFKTVVIEKFNSDRGICEELFQTTGKLHLTVDVMTLADSIERHVAIDTLRTCKELFVDPFHLNKPIKIRVKGLEIMNDDPSEVRVLYGNILTENSGLQDLVDNIAHHFSQTGLTCALREKIKLHATVMNARFVSLRTGDIERKDHTFDVRNLLKHLKDYDFGEVLVDRVLLSQSHTIAQNGYYETSAEIKFYSLNENV